MRNVPKLRFKEFSEEWEEKKLGEVLKIGNGKDYKNLEQGEIPVYGTGGLITKVNDYLYNGESVGIGRKGTINKPMFLTGKFWTVDTLFYTYDFNNSIPKFIYYIFNNIDWLSYNEATGVPSLSKSTILKIKSFVPDLQEQQKIADFLSSVDKKISITEKKLDLFKEYKKGIMQKIFNQELRFKDSNGNDYPKWEEKRLGNICYYFNGGSLENYVVNNGKYNLITLNSISIEGNLKKEHKTVNINKNLLNKYDLVMVLSDVAHGNFLGLTAIIPEDNMFVLNQRMGGLKIKYDENVYYLRYYINSNQFYFKLHGQGSSQLNLSKKDIEDFIVKLPCLEEQQKIADFLSSIDNKIDNLAAELENLKEFKKGLLQQMFV